MNIELTLQLAQEQDLQSPEQQLQEQGDMLIIGLDGYKPQKDRIVIRSCLMMI